MTAPDPAVPYRSEPAPPPDAPAPVMLRDLPRTVLAVLLLALLIAASLWILRPFLLSTVWATMIVVATWPLLLEAQKRLRRRAPAVALISLAMLVIFFAPVLLMIDTLAENTGTIAGWIHTLTSSPIPPPPQWVRDLPLVGERIAAMWSGIAASGLGALAPRAGPYAADAARWAARLAGGAGLLVVQLVLTVLISIILYAHGEAARDMLVAFGRRLAGDNGERVVLLAGASIRAVALGVVGTALVQTVLAGIGLAAAGIPLAGFLTALVLLFCIAQVGPMVVLVPAVIWLFWNERTGWGIALLVWSLVVGTLDNVLRPYLIRKGANLPLLLIFAGVIGGLIAFGVIGLFVGPVVLAIVYMLLQQWLQGREGT